MYDVLSFACLEVKEQFDKNALDYRLWVCLDIVESIINYLILFSRESGLRNRNRYFSLAGLNSRKQNFMRKKISTNYFFCDYHLYMYTNSPVVTHCDRVVNLSNKMEIRGLRLLL